MTHSRRDFLKYGISLTAASALPTIWIRNNVTGYTPLEIKERLKRDQSLSKHDLPTLCLAVDLDLFEENLEKISRLVSLTKRQPDTMTVVDHPDHVRELSDAAEAASLTLNIMIDIGPIGRRTGIATG